MTDDRGQMTDGRSQISDGRSQISDDISQKTEANGPELNFKLLITDVG